MRGLTGDAETERLCRGERGAVMYLVAVLLPAVMLLFGVVGEWGRVVGARAAMQSATDSAASAGAAELFEDAERCALRDAADRLEQWRTEHRDLARVETADGSVKLELLVSEQQVARCFTTADHAAAESEAERALRRNGVAAGADVQSPAPPGAGRPRALIEGFETDRSVEVVARRRLPAAFGFLLGRDSFHVQATSLALADWRALLDRTVRVPRG